MADARGVSEWASLCLGLAFRGLAGLDMEGRK